MGTPPRTRSRQQRLGGEKSILDRRSFPMAKGLVKFLLVGVDYFTKWIEVEPLTIITAQKVQRYGLPHSVVTDNRTQFPSKRGTMIPIKIGEPSLRRGNFNPEDNTDAIRVDLNLVKKAREQACIR
ncbi:hypothetical protein CR513_40232, partial [Mucuna pruriens]